MFVPILHKSLIFYTDELEAETPHINFPTKIIWRSLFTFFLLCTITSLLCWKIFYVAGVFFAVMSILYLVLLFRLCKVIFVFCEEWITLLWEVIMCLFRFFINL